MKKTEAFKSANKIRIVTAASLFDGHDAAINIMRRIIQSSGAEVIHLGHDRSVQEVVDCAIQEDAQAIAMTSYQGGHMEYFKYMYDLLKEKGCSHIKIFGGGGGTILPEEIKELQAYGIARIYHPDDGRSMGLQGMINDLLEKASTPLPQEEKKQLVTGSKFLSNGWVKDLHERKWSTIAALISLAENDTDQFKKLFESIPHNGHSTNKKSKTGISDSTPPFEVGVTSAPVLGITGTGGAGKSSLVDELVRRFLIDFKDKNIAIVSVDPSKRKTGGALLGDRIRMNSISNPRVYMRSLATRQSNLALSKHVKDAVDVLKAANYDLIILETSGIGQSDTEIIEHSDVSLYVMTPEYGAASQLEKIDMLDFADIIALNKSDKRGALDAIRDVKKQYKRNHNLFQMKDEDVPVFGTIASQFNDPGMNRLYRAVIDTINQKCGATLDSHFEITGEMSEKIYIIPPARIRYLSEISETVRGYNKWTKEQSDIANKLYALHSTIEQLNDSSVKDKEKIAKKVEELYHETELLLDGQKAEHCIRQRHALRT